MKPLIVEEGLTVRKLRPLLLFPLVLAAVVLPGSGHAADPRPERHGRARILDFDERRQRRQGHAHSTPAPTRSTCRTSPPSTISTSSAPASRWRPTWPGREHDLDGHVHRRHLQLPLRRPSGADEGLVRGRDGIAAASAGAEAEAEEPLGQGRAGEDDLPEDGAPERP